MPRLKLDIANFSLKLNFDENFLFKQFKKNFVQKSIKDIPKKIIEVDILAEDKKENKKRPFDIYHSKDFFRALNDKYSLYYDKINRRAFILCIKNPYVLKNALRLLTIVLINKNVIFLHASSAKCINQAIIFCGPSGSGKTTLTKLLPKKFDILSDDLSIISFKKGSYYVAGDDFTRKSNILDKVKIREVLFLKKSDRNKKVNISKAKALALIFSICPLTDGQKEEYNTLRKFSEFIKVVPTYILEFRNDQSIKDFFIDNYEKK
jgi:hypothetical protein